MIPGNKILILESFRLIGLITDLSVEILAETPSDIKSLETWTPTS